MLEEDEDSINLYLVAAPHRTVHHVSTASLPYHRGAPMSTSTSYAAAGGGSHGHVVIGFIFCHPGFMVHDEFFFFIARKA